MSAKSLVMLCMTIGSLVGSYLPVLFGVSAFSYITLVTGFIGGIAGIIIGYQLGKDL